MGLFGSLTKMVYDVATSPIAVIKDVATMGGAVTGERSAIAEKLEQLQDDSDEIRRELSE